MPNWMTTRSGAWARTSRSRRSRASRVVVSQMPALTTRALTPWAVKAPGKRSG